MKPATILTLVIIASIASSALGQTAPSQTAEFRKFLLRAEIVDETSGHTIRDCILLQPDGRYHREHAEETTWRVSRTPVHESQKFDTYVFEGVLTDQETREVAEFINDGSFRAIRKPDQLRLSRQFLFVDILREGEKPQSFILGQAADYKPNQKALKPLFGWMNAMSKRKHDVSKAEGNSCRVSDLRKSELGLRTRTADR